jgi:hypothetical protein
MLVGCGRIGFDGPSAEAGAGDGNGDGADATDAATDVATDAGLPAGLVAWLRFDAYVAIGATRLFSDQIAGRSGSCTGAECPGPTAGHLGGAFEFDGSDDCITVPDTGHLQLPQLTIALWARQMTSGTASQVAKPVLGGSTNSWQLETDANSGALNSLTFTTYDGNGNTFLRSPDNTIVIGQWHHFAVTFDGTTKRQFIDGGDAGSGAHVALIYDAKAMQIGCDENGGARALHFQGALDDLQIYGRALTMVEVAQLAAR